MRWRRLVVAAVLVLAACGGASDSSDPTSTSSAGSTPTSAVAEDTAVEATADALISAMGDARTALAAVLLSADLGYGVEQIVTAGVDGRLTPDGSISTAQGRPVTPVFEPSEILDDDINSSASEVSEASGLRSPPPRTGLTAMIDQLNRLFGGDRGSLITVLVLFSAGYSLEQIVLAVIADFSVDDDFYLFDDEGNLIVPERDPTRSHLDRELDRNAPWESIPDPDTVGTEPLDLAERVSGGSIHAVTAETPGLDTDSAFCLDYSEELVEDGFRLSLTACTDAPDFDVVHDLDAGTVAGEIELELECLGDEDRCDDKDRVVGTVSGSFGPFAYGQQPEVAPDEWPFPDHHWYAGASSWWAGGPIELDVSISGDHYILEDAYSAAVTTTITGWAESQLSPSRLTSDQLPTDWMVDLRVIVEYVETDEPRWDFYTGYFWMFEETGVDVPSWQQ